MLTRFLKPRPTISDEEVASGLKWLTLEGMTSLGFFSITTSGFLAAFALALGANNLQIGILAAIPFITQPLQIPVIPLVERVRRRKAIVLAAWIPAQLLWIPIALIPFFLDVPSAGAISVLLGLLAVRGVLNAICNCAWNTWIRDLIPQQILATFMGKRLALASLAAMLFGLGAAFFADYWKQHASADAQVLGYTYPLLFGIFTLAMASPLFMALMPEPLMQAPVEPKQSLLSTIAAPFRDKNYKSLLRFLFLWGLAINLATPFFAVYMLQRIGLPLSAVIGFSVLSQAFNIMFLRVWGKFADQFGIKVILSLCVSLYLLVILGWTFTTMPERYFLTIPLLVVLHILAGIAAAGVTLATGTIGMRLAPAGRATAYLAGAGLAISLGAGLGPLVGGYLADFFSTRQLSLTLAWSDPSHYFEFGALHLTGFDFVFGLTFVLGLLTLPLLAAVREQGEASREVVLESLYAPARGITRPLSSVAGLSFLSHFPYGFLRRVPVPGLDVALGVTAYQVAETARLATISAMEGKKTVGRAIGALESALSKLWKVPSDGKPHSVEIARHSARGAIHALEELAFVDVGQLSHYALLSVVRSLRRIKADPRDVLRGASYGIIEGASETGADLGKAAQQAVAAATKTAQESGLTEENAASEATLGALSAAESLGENAVAQVREALQDGASGTLSERDEPGTESGRMH